MAGDKFQKVAAGQPLIIPAPTWNSVLDAARAHAESRLDQAEQANSAFRQASIIKVRNQSGQDLNRCAILGIDGPIIDPVDSQREFKNQTAVNGVLPTAEHAGRFVVLLEPLKAGKLGRAWASGVCPVQVQMSAPWHTHVDIDPGSPSRLVSRPTGGAQILWRGIGSWLDSDFWNDNQGWDQQTLWALVRLSSVHLHHYVAKIPAGGIPARQGEQLGSASCELFTVSSQGMLAPMVEADNEARVVVRHLGSEPIEPPESGVGYVAVTWDGRDSWLADGSSSSTQSGDGGPTEAVVFSLSSNLTPGIGNTALATVLVSGAAGLIPGDTILVYNTGEKKAFAGSLGWAISINGQLWIVEVNQYALLSLATLSSDTHGLSPGSGTVGDMADQRPIMLSSLTAVSTYPHSFIPSPLPTLTNPHNLLAKSGDQATVVYNETVDQWQIVAVHPAVMRAFRFKLTADMPAGLTPSTTSYSVQAPVWDHAGGDLPDPLPPLRDSYSLAANAKTNATGCAEYNWKLDVWEITSITHVATLLRAQIQTSFTSTPSTITVTPVVAFNGSLPSGDLTVQNIYKWHSGLVNKAFLIIWNPVDEQWEPVQMECP
jgi:hypothetical protein